MLFWRCVLIYTHTKYIFGKYIPLLLVAANKIKYAKPNVAIFNIVIFIQFNPYSFNLISIFIQFNPYSFNLIPIVIQFNPYSFNSIFRSIQFNFYFGSIWFLYSFNSVSKFIQFSFCIHSIQFLYSFNSGSIFIQFNFYIHSIQSVFIGPLQDPVTWYRINYTGTQVTQWDLQK